MAKTKRAMWIKELDLLDFIDSQPRATSTMVQAKAGGPREYENYFGENGALTRKRREVPHPVTGVKEVVEYCMVETQWDGNTKIHTLTQHGHRYRKALSELVFFWNPYAEAAGGKLKSKVEI